MCGKQIKKENTFTDKNDLGIRSIEQEKGDQLAVSSSKSHPRKRGLKYDKHNFKITSLKEYCDF